MWVKNVNVSETFNPNRCSTFDYFCKLQASPPPFPYGYKVYEPSLICTVYSVCLQYMKAMKVTLTTPTPLIPKVFLHRKALVKKNGFFFSKKS